jgi:hypothetical protein
MMATVLLGGFMRRCTDTHPDGKAYERWEIVTVYALDTFDGTPMRLGTTHAKPGEYNHHVRERFGDGVGLHKKLSYVLPFKHL